MSKRSRFTSHGLKGLSSSFDVALVNERERHSQVINSKTYEAAREEAERIHFDKNVKTKVRVSNVQLACRLVHGQDLWLQELDASQRDCIGKGKRTNLHYVARGRKPAAFTMKVTNECTRRESFAGAAFSRSSA
jgi:hypothetical protein